VTTDTESRTLYDLIRQEMHDDQEPEDKISEELLFAYSEGTAASRAGIDACLRALCGWSMPTLLRTLQRGYDNPIESYERPDPTPAELDALLDWASNL
jgi:hypothetical protein